MTTILCKNYHKNTEITHIEFVLEDGQNLTRIFSNDKLLKELSTVIFLKQIPSDFQYPLLNVGLVAATDDELTLQYDSFEDILTLPAKLLTAFIHHYPRLQTIYTKPTDNYLTVNQIQTVLLHKGSNIKLATIDSKQLTKLVNHQDNNIPYHYFNGYLLDDEYSLNDFPEVLDLEDYSQTNHSILNVSQAIDSNAYYLRYMHPKIGFGLFANRAIKKGEILMAYTGELTTKAKYQNTNYSFKFNQGGLHKKLDGIKFGNLARFINHANDVEVKAKCKKFDFSDAFVLTENVRSKKYKVNGIEFIYLIAKEDILPNQQLCFNYGKYYWKQRTHHMTFIDNKRMLSDSGEILSIRKKLPVELYKQADLHLPFITFFMYNRLLIIFVMLILILASFHKVEESSSAYLFFSSLLHVAE
jgi:hypothetical protein